MRAWLLTAGILAALAGAGRAEPAPQISDIVVAGHDHVLATAVGDAFASSGMAIREVDDAPPATVAELATASRAVADREHARSVIWLIADASGATLVAYDREVDRVLVRALPYTPPLTPARAAETARMARTMLRALQVPDEPEPAPPPPPPREVLAIAPPPEPPPAPLAVLAGGGGRMGRLGEAGALEVTLAAIWRPDALGVIAFGSLAPEARLDSAAFMGHTTDHTFGLAARLPMMVAPRVGIAAIAGIAVHAVGITGSYGGEAVANRRFDPALRGGASAGYAVTPRIELGVGVTADALLRRQRYELPGGEPLVMPRLQASVTLMVTLRLL